MVISIITVIVAFTAPSIVKLLGSSEVNAMRSILNGLASAADSYNITTGQTVDHKVTRDAFGNDVDIEINGTDASGDPIDFTFGWFVLNAGQVPESAQLITISAKEDLTLNGDPLLDINGEVAGLAASQISSIELRDRWRTPIRYAGGVRHDDRFNADDYLRAHPTAFFVSAGPDGLFGEVDTDTNGPDPDVDENDDGIPDAQDNIYSFDLN